MTIHLPGIDTSIEEKYRLALVFCGGAKEVYR
jgi:hypothetical protein